MLYKHTHASLLSVLRCRHETVTVHTYILFGCLYVLLLCCSRWVEQPTGSAANALIHSFLCKTISFRPLGALLQHASLFCNSIIGFHLASLSVCHSFIIIFDANVMTILHKFALRCFKFCLTLGTHEPVLSEQLLAPLILSLPGGL